MQIDLIETFLDLVDSRSFNRTADRMGLTQSTVSARIQSLETTLGTRLFSRSRAGTALTTAGLTFESHARTLRHAWAEAQHAVGGAGTTALTLRIGIQNDLAAGRIGDWVSSFRRALPDCGYYIEPDYSAQMCADLGRGSLDFAVIYTPHAQPDLYFVSLGEVSYRLIASAPTARTGLAPQTYIRANYSPAFGLAHAQRFPDLSGATLASGQNAVVAGMLTALGGAAFVLEETAVEMIATGGFHAVAGADPITQPVYGAMHLRHRPSRLHRSLTRLVARQLSARAGG